MAALIFPIGFYINEVGGQPYKLPNNTVVGSSYVLFVLSIFFTIVGLLFAGKVCLPGWGPPPFPQGVGWGTFISESNKDAGGLSESITDNWATDGTDRTDSSFYVALWKSVQTWDVDVRAPPPPLTAGIFMEWEFIFPCFVSSCSGSVASLHSLVKLRPDTSTGIFAWGENPLSILHLIQTHVLINTTAPGLPVRTLWGRASSVLIRRPGKPVTSTFTKLVTQVCVCGGGRMHSSLPASFCFLINCLLFMCHDSFHPSRSQYCWCINKIDLLTSLFLYFWVSFSPNLDLLFPCKLYLASPRSETFPEKCCDRLFMTDSRTTCLVSFRFRSFRI